ncbi:MAG: polyprenyl synthetase family protein [Candidatus Iainarchaeum archaeon]|uniref:Polyprenyl synthetase family protein n=1 Tax=Candidatus Iainarchaeum sp. TaxID=3101447 RepID=A0A7T9I1N0_9ARCH|nr:MAG: polyprenyl synthetase family protein [Candidatus Diapherotrites archaeon]
MDFGETTTRYREKVDNALQSYFEKKHKEITVKDPIAEENFFAMQNYVSGKGKRLRSICAIAGFFAVGGKDEEKITLPSLSVEFLHNASLILDDMMDEDRERRGFLSAHSTIEEWFDANIGKTPYNGYLFSNAKSRFAVSMSVIAADMLLSLGEQTIIESKFSGEQKVDAIAIYEKTYRQLNLGQMLDVYYEYKPLVSEENYLNMAYLKTGTLLGGSLKLGAALGGATESQLKALEEYALHAATCFQIQDDILDITPGAEKGRPLGSDIRKGKNTILVIEAKKTLNEKEWKKVEHALGNEKIGEKELNEIMQLFKEKNIVTNAQKIAEENIAKGKAALRKAKPAFDKEWMQFLDALADYLLHRSK